MLSDKSKIRTDNNIAVIKILIQLAEWNFNTVSVFNFKGLNFRGWREQDNFEGLYFRG